jgi:putative tricarboxylic transport membrane protein
MSDPQTTRGDTVGARWPEVCVAAVLFLLAILVITDSIRVGTGWADDGPRSGYFPFYIGLLLAGSSAWILIQQVLRWARDNPKFADRGELASVWSMLWPLTIYIVSINFLGIYVASALLIGYFMKRHGRYGWPLTAAVSIGVPLVFFLVFEKWFLVLLPKGPLEAAFGL